LGAGAVATVWIWTKSAADMALLKCTMPSGGRGIRKGRIVEL